MITFTKDELEILKSLSSSKESAIMHNKSYQYLADKIQLMIDSYHHIKPPTMANYCCPKCIEEWHNCKCEKGDGA